MSLSDIRREIKTALEGVPGIGIVHDYQRWSNQWDKFLEKFKNDDGSIRGCMFSREKYLKRQRTLGDREEAHIFVFRFIMGLQDAEATGIVLDVLIQNAADAFTDDSPDKDTLNDTCLTIHPDWGPLADLVGLQIDIIEPRMFGGVLCHYAEGRLCVLV